MKRSLVAIIVAIVGLSACNSAHDARPQTQGTSTPRSTAATQSSPSSSPAAMTHTVATTTHSAAHTTPCTSSSGGDEAEAQLVDVRVGTHDTYDRVTFEFASQTQIPAFTIRSVTTPTYDGSGAPIHLAGDSYAEIVFQHSSAFDLGGNRTYDGPTHFAPGFKVLAEVKEAGDFERVLSWAMGLSDSSCWQVSTLQNPARVVVDFPY
jgi:hypothetical protein